MTVYQIWAIIGLILLIAELYTRSFFIIFFGIGGVITAVTTFIGLTPNFATQLISFSVSSILLLILFRKRLRRRMGGDTPTLPPDFIGQRVKVTRDIPAGDEGQVLYRGSTWIAFSDAEDEIKAGSMVEIIGNDGLRLRVRRLSSERPNGP